MLLEDRLSGGEAALLFHSPQEIVRCDGPGEIDGAFDRIAAGLKLGLHAAGFMAYELGFGLEPRLRPLALGSRPTPLIWMGLFPPPERLAQGAVDEMFAALGPPPPIAEVRLGHDRAAHVKKVRRVLEFIAAGDVYQANLTFPIRFRYEGDPLALYAALRVRQPVAHGGVVDFGEATVLSVSPELFLRIDAGQAASRPMKGTAARRADPVADAEAARALAADPKQQAENLMIVDLIRNDLSRICTPGSVTVADLFEVETYPSFHALTSTVSGRLRPGLGLREQIAALFPCGSIVGAPKIRAAEILAGLEDAPRGVYTGAMGWFAPEGGVELNVAIRTALIDPNGEGFYGVGGGVVADSDPDAEYDEALLKARVLTDLASPYHLIETLKWSLQDGYVRLSRHLNRLAASAALLGFRFDRAAAEDALGGRAQSWTVAPHDRRVRLSLTRPGELSIEDAPAPAADDRWPRVGFASERLDAGDPFLRHKTSRRDGYERALAEASAAGLDEAILLNRSGEVADGSRHSVFARVDGGLVTPPLTAGALPGVLRAALIEEGRVSEASLTPEALRQADEVLLGNSLRGLRRARLEG